MSFQEFLSMGGYAAFVWPSYGLVLLVFILNLILPVRRKADIEKSISRFYRQQQGRANP